MQFFATIINDRKSFTIFANSSILYVCLRSEHASAANASLATQKTNKFYFLCYAFVLAPVRGVLLRQVFLHRNSESLMKVSDLVALLGEVLDSSSQEQLFGRGGRDQIRNERTKLSDANKVNQVLRNRSLYSKEINYFTFLFCESLLSFCEKDRTNKYCS